MEETFGFMVFMMSYGALGALLGWHLAKTYYTETDENDDDDEQGMGAGN